jgi:signal transduction histidine kinase
MDPQSVLVVEDDAALSALVAGLLTQAGYDPVAISDHDLIDAAIERWKPRCVILDGEVRSSGESRTWDDAAGIRQAHPSLPVVIFSADGAALAEVSEGRSARSQAAGFAGIVSKPFVIEEFLATVKSAVEHPPTAPTASEVATARPITVFPDVGRLAADWPETDLFGTIVHELRGPLTVIRGQVQLARRQIGKDPTRERLAMDSAIVQVDRMGQLITELLDHARLASNGLSLNVIVLDLASALSTAIEIHQFEANPRISLHRPTGDVSVQGDPERIAQILDNLIGNALKYSAATAPVEVSLALEGAEAQARITDHGVGIPEDERHLLFTPFYRSSRTRDVRGTGLGLHISRRLAERHGGRLWLEASSTAGSVFVLALPIV